MGISEDWHELMFELTCLTKGSAKKQFRQSIKYAFGGLCAYCRCKRATTIDHLKPRSRGGSNLRSNLVPACLECNHAKGSEDWLTWYQRQDYYNSVAQELIEEWIINKRLDDEEDQLNERTTNFRATVCSNEGTIRSFENEQTCPGKDCFTPA